MTSGGAANLSPAEATAKAVGFTSNLGPSRALTIGRKPYLLGDIINYHSCC